MKRNVDLTEHGLFTTSNLSELHILSMMFLLEKPWEFKLEPYKENSFLNSKKKPWDFNINSELDNVSLRSALAHIIRKPWEFDKSYVMWELSDSGGIKFIYSFTPQSKLIMTGDKAEREHKREYDKGNLTNDNILDRDGHPIKPWNF